MTNMPAFISSAQHTPPKPLKIQEEIDELMVGMFTAKVESSLNLYLSAVFNMMNR